MIEGDARDVGDEQVGRLQDAEAREAIRDDLGTTMLVEASAGTGKTTCMLALMEHLNATGRYRALYANIEGAQTAREVTSQ
jgi:ATP-dependent exoDNAse (exonuclease V) beta subunit